MANEILAVRKGESMDFEFDLDGDSIDGWVCTIIVKRHTTDTAFVTRVISADDTTESWPGFLTPTETTALAIGQYQLIGQLTNASTGEEQQVVDTFRFNITDAWA